MNSERLHGIARLLARELEEYEVAQKLQALGGAYINVATSPGQVQFQEELQNRLSDLNRILSSAPSNAWGTTRREAAEELGLWGLTGARLLGRIEEARELGEDVTPAVVGANLQALSNEVEERLTQLRSLTAAMEAFGIGFEELEPGEFELGVVIPRSEVRNELEALGKNFVQIKKRIGPFNELVTGTRPDLELRTISSSDFSVFVELLPQVAAILMDVLDKTLDLLEKQRRFRELIGEFLDDGEDIGVEEGDVAPLKGKVEQSMDANAKQIAETLIQEFMTNLKPNRAEEVRLDVYHSINWLANRVDHHYSFEIHAGPVPEDGDLDEDVRDAATRIGELQERQQAREILPTEMLQLPEGEPGEGPKADQPEAEGEAG